MDKKNIAIGVLVITTLLLSFLYFTNPVFLGVGTGPAHYQNESFLQGLTAGTGSQLSVSNVGALTQSGAATFSDVTRIYSPITTGAVTVLSGSTTTIVTAAQACAGVTAYASSSITAASTLNLPTAEDMFAACLTTNGDSVTMFARNMTASTTVITAGSASTTIAIDNGGTVTLGALGTARIIYKRLSSTLMYAFVSVFKP